MNTINLLPKNVQRIKDVRRENKIMAAILAAVFLVCFTFFVFLSVRESQVLTEIANLNEALRQNPSLQQNNPFLDLSHDEFLTNESIKNAATLPQGAWINGIRFNHGEFILSAGTFNIQNIRIHQEILEDFFEVRLLRLLADADGSYSYEFILIKR